MGRSKASRRSKATNPVSSKKLSYKHSTANTNTKVTHPKPTITIQERLQDMSLTHWHQPIDEALDLHLHGLLPVTGKTLAPDSWTKWPKRYCRAMIQLVQLVTPSQANELLTNTMAAIGRPEREIGTQPRLLWLVVYEAKVRSGKTAGVIAGNEYKGEIWCKWICCPHYKPLPCLKDEISNFARFVLANFLNRPQHVAFVQRLEEFIYG